MEMVKTVSFFVCFSLQRKGKIMQEQVIHIKKLELEGQLLDIPELAV